MIYILFYSNRHRVNQSQTLTLEKFDSFFLKKKYFLYTYSPYIIKKFFILIKKNLLEK